MANDHAQDRYDPPKVGSEYEEEQFSEINPGELFRLFASNDARCIASRMTTLHLI